ncbi:ribonuclease H-like domain-containing protein [Danxiaibacter flavus]|uniref:Ribonuclease H-like domain-containing protein n=1 Tax=Danxiaibacter flavus TaxID=3049108 RepID=A0ABV3ZGN9_9BACT|nr:ribonuclease H-like domain-containing protein [Chitinophagaceae bacterium DXS]
MNNGISLFDLLVLDIETVPQFEGFSHLNIQWKSLWIDKNSKIVPENITPDESYEQRAGILAEFGKIICISTGYFFEDEQKNICFKIKSFYGDDEKELLNSFVAICNKFYQRNRNFQFSGHNIKEFDIPYICRRMLINQIPLPEYLQIHGAKPWEIKMLDTLQWWRFGDYKNYISLNLLASVLDVPTSKTDIDGSMVQHVYYKEKNLQRIVEYCQKDIIVVANVILRFKNLPILKDELIGVV